VLADRGGDLWQRIEGAGIHLACLRADQHRTGCIREHPAQFARDDAALVIGCDPAGTGGAQAQQPERLQQRYMSLLPHHDRQLGSIPQAIRGHVPACRRQQRVPGGGETGEVGHLGAGHESHRGLRWQAEQVEQPGGRDLLDDRGSGRHDVHRGVLVEGRHEPVGGQRGRQAAPGNEAEVTRPGGRHQARLQRGSELGDQADRFLACFA